MENTNKLIIKHIEQFEYKCAVCPKKIAKYFSENDNVLYCDDCKKERSYNNFLDIEKYKMATIFFNYNKITENFQNIKEYNNQMDEKNKFLLLDYDSFFNLNKSSIICGPKWYNCGLFDEDPFLSVSFVGNTGSGKSSTIANICIDRENNHPVPGSLASSTSTSTDINSFLCQTECEKKLKYLVFDSEGGSGSYIPELLKRKFDKMCKKNKENIELSELFEKRNEFVKYSYPKLLYSFSDVFVFTFIGSHKEQHIISDIIGYSTISTNSYNNISKPHLIILFNMQPLELNNDDIDISTKKYFEQQKKNLDELYKYYESVSVFYLPNIGYSNSLNKYIKEVASFKKLINKKVEESLKKKKLKKYDFTTKTSLDIICKMINSYNINGAKETQDFSKLYKPLSKCDTQLELRYRSETSLGGHRLLNEVQVTVDNILIYFGSCYQFFIEKENCTRKEAFDLSKSIIKNKLPKIYENFLKRNLSGDNKKIPDVFKSVLEEITSNIHKKYGPCQFKIKNKYDCINFEDTHSCHKSVEHSFESFSIFKMKFTKVKVHYDEAGAHQPPMKENFVKYFEENPKRKVKIDELFIKSNFIDYQNVCIGCLYDSPTIPYTCNHILCSNCAKNSNDKCTIEGCNGLIRHKKEIDFNSLMGCRILSLDGGGIRGISESCILEKISKECYDIPIHKLFDLIVGTSTGALIALALVATENSPNNITGMFESMAKEVFSNFIIKIPVIGQIYSIIFSKYGRAKIHECIKKVLKDKTLYQSFESSRVAVTSVTNYAGKWEDVLFLNYYRRINENEQPNYINDALCSDGAEASSAAPFYFAPFVYKEKIYLDGGLTNNNPCRVALKESKLLWPDKKIDLFLSVGSGLFKNKNGSEYSQIIAKNAENFINLYIESEKAWKEIRNKDTIIENLNFFRYNVEFENEIGLDNGDKSTINKLKDCTNLFLGSFHENNSIASIINKSLSSLFYLDMVTYEKKSNILKGKIKCRLDKLPSELCDQLNKKDNKCFNIRKNGAEKTEVLIKKSEITNDKVWDIEFTIINTPDEIDIICALVGKKKIINETSISGCPFLKSDFNKLNIKSI